MTDTTINFRAIRAGKAGDNRLWLPEDALEDALAEVKTGLLSPKLLYVAMLAEEKGVDLCTLRYYAAGGTKTELAGLLTRHLHRLCQSE